jgi:hypothetical protein
VKRRLLRKGWDDLDGTTLIDRLFSSSFVLAQDQSRCDHVIHMCRATYEIITIPDTHAWWRPQVPLPDCYVLVVARGGRELIGNDELKGNVVELSRFN